MKAIHVPYYETYVSKVDTHSVLDALQNTEKTSLAIIEKLSEAQGNYRYAEGKWTIKELLVHIIDVERIFATRALCIARGEKQNIHGFDENEYAANSNSNRRSMKNIIAEYKAVRASSIALFESFDDNDMVAKGIASNSEFNVLALAYIISGHNVHHINVLEERYL